MEHTADDDFDDMSGSIEEEELAHDEGLDQHDRARRNDCQQTDDVHDSNDVEDNIASAGKRPPKAGHDLMRCRDLISRCFFRQDEALESKCVDNLHAVTGDND